MKLSELKEIIIRQIGSEEWEKLKNSYEYKVYSSNEEEQLEILKRNPYTIKFINNPTEKMQLDVIKYDDINIKINYLFYISLFLTYYLLLSKNYFTSAIYNF